MTMLTRTFLTFVVLGTSFLIDVQRSGAQDKTSERVSVVLDEVIVTATRGEKSVSDAPGSVTVITKEEIEKRPSISMSTLLSSIPGFSFRRSNDFTLATPTATVRGISGNRTLVMLDGIPMMDPRTGEIQMDGLNPGSLQRIEAVKGPMSALYGSAMAGAVNLVTAMPEQREVLVNIGYGSAFDRGQANDDVINSYFSYGDKIADSLSFRFSYNRKETNGFANQLNVIGTRPASGPYKEILTPEGNARYIRGDKGDQTILDEAFTAKVQYEFNEDTRLKLNFIRNELESTYDVPHSIDGAPVYGSADAWGRTGYQNTYGEWGRERNVYSGSFETKFSDLFTKLSLSLLDSDYYSANGAGRTADAPAATFYGGNGLILEAPSKTYLADLQFGLPLFSNQNLTWGFSYKYDTMEAKNNYLSNWKERGSVTGVRDRNGGDTSLWSVYVQDEIDVTDELTLYLGGRMDWWKVSDAYSQDSRGQDKSRLAYQDRSDSSFSPKAAAVYRPLEDTTIRLTGGKAFNSPTLYQLFSTYGTSTTIYKANPNLKPETVWSWDFSVNQLLWAGAEVTVGYFENHMEDLISSGNVNIDGVTRSRENIGQARSRGLELEFRQSIGEHLTFATDYTYTDSKIIEDRNSPTNVGNRLQLVPMHLWNVSLEGEYGPVRAYLGGRYISKRHGSDANTDYANNVYGSYDPVFTADAKISYDINENLTASVTANNIFDRHYYDGSYIAPGASWYVDLAFHY